MKKLAGVLLLLLGATWGFSQEYLERFDSAVTVDKQGTAWVKETIAVAGASENEPPLYRNLPAQAQDITLTKNGEPCPFTLEPDADRVRVLFAFPSETISQPDVYQLQYHVPGAVAFRPERDLLDWNVTGHWPVALEKVNFELLFYSKSRWCSYFLAGSKNFPLFAFARDCFLQYWEKSNALIDYLFVDYVLGIAYDNFAEIRKVFDSVEDNNSARGLLMEKINEEYSAQLFCDLSEKETFLSKLSWRYGNPRVLTADGKISNYGHLLEL